MSHREAESDAEEMTTSIDRVVAELRSAVPVRAEWRVGLLRGIALLPPPGRVIDSPPAIRQWRFRPLMAIAAGLVCALGGAGAAALLLGRRGRGARGPRSHLASPMP